jgi:aldehyde:ferredoxin oxidoreductase
MKRTDVGWAGKILRVNLSERKWYTEPTEPCAHRFIGGIGIGSKIFFEEVGPEVGAFDPQNKLIFTPGPLTGTLAPASGRFEIVSRSPRNYPKEAFNRSGMGGFWGPELKFAGYDALIIEGKADALVNIWIRDETVEFRDAEEYRGEDTYSTQQRLREELDPSAKILCIGPAGEKLSRLGVIMSETGFVSGKTGFGAVMGSKNLKAIAVRGTKSLKIFDLQKLMNVSRQVRKLSANNPMREWTSLGNLPLEDQIEFLRKYRNKNTSCFSCSMQCFAYLKIPGSGEAQAHCINYYYGPAAYSYYGKSLEADQAIMDSFILANRLGLDTFELHAMLLFLKEAYAKGLLKQEPEIPFEKYGSREFIRTFLDAIAQRKGIGDLLAEGGPRAADRIKDSWEIGAKYYPAHGSSFHEDLRDYAGLALLWATDTRDPIIDHHSYRKVAVTFRHYPPSLRYSDDQLNNISERLFGTPRAIDQSTFEDKAKAITYSQNRSGLINLLVVCDWIYPLFYSNATEDHMGDTSMESQLFSAVTGNEISEKEGDQFGERVWNLMRAISILEGRTRKEDTLHEFYFKAHRGEKGLSLPDFEKAKTEYYQARGWDEVSGWPTKNKLVELGLSDVAEVLERTRSLPSD